MQEDDSKVVPLPRRTTREVLEVAEEDAYMEASLQFEQAVQEQLDQLQTLCTGNLHLKINGDILFVSADAVFAALRDQVLKGLVDLNFAEDPGRGHLAEIIRFDASRKQEEALHRV